MKVTNYEISKRLKELGFKAESVFTWTRDKKIFHIAEVDGYMETKAYDLETILEALPKNALYFEFGLKGNQFLVKSCEDMVFQKKDESLADTAARLLIILIEKGLVEVKNV